MTGPEVKRKKKKYDLDHLFQVVGEVTVLWAFLDSLLDDCIEAIHGRWGGNKLFDKTPTISLRRKIAYLRKWYSQDDRLAVIFPTLPDLFDALEAAAEQRHRLIHGIPVWPHEFETKGRVSFYRERVRLKGGAAESVTFTLASLKEFREWVYRFAIFFWRSSRDFGRSGFSRGAE